MESSLRCSLEEVKAREAWARPVTKVACYLALHAEDAEARIATCLGGIVRADSRRIDEVKSGVEDVGGNAMLLTQSVLAMASSVV